MSRGGRGGFGRGRGGPGGMSLPFGDDIKPDYSVSELFPPCPQPTQTPLSKEERATISRFRSHREKIRNGPMYTVMARKRGQSDPFTDISRYSARYLRQTRRTPKLDARPYVYEFFPVELYSTIGKDEGGEGEAGKKKRLLFSSLDTLNPLEEMMSEEEAEGKVEEGGKEEVPEEDDEEEMDEFDDDDEGDYNGEQYFDGGEDYDEDMGDDRGDAYYD
ncbi:hypothetical protein EX30DRAFT_339476 [Ascodesmis nigricans]|uniref:DNA-directed RNA polymerase III subunit n=1 Tax=Ascodesmis nigricans TaxID=341454 RepID=A0A4S2N2K2_9PEZI|nr:hypothetical protein EX30DRAFT_339476 [Ascodesmis nigricans]